MRAAFSLLTASVIAMLTAVAGNTCVCGAAEVVPLVLMDEVPLPDAVRNLARNMGLNIIIDPCVPGSYYTAGSKTRAPEVSFRFENKTVEEVFSYVLQKYKLVAITNPATTVARIVPLDHCVKPIPFTPSFAETNGLQPAIHLTGVTLTEAIKTVAKAAELKVDFDPRFSTLEHGRNETTDSFHWTNLTPRQALVALLDNFDLVMNEQTPGAVRISLKAPEEPDPHGRRKSKK